MTVEESTHRPEGGRAVSGNPHLLRAGTNGTPGESERGESCPDLVPLHAPSGEFTEHLVGRR